MSTSTQDELKQKAQDVASRAREATENLQQSDGVQGAKQNAQNVASEARQQGAQLKQEAVQQARGIADEATTQLQQHASTQTERIASQLRQFTDQAQAFMEGRKDEAGPLPQYAQQATEKLSGFAERLEQGGADGALRDVRNYARRKPGTFLLFAGIAGFAAGRMVQGAKANHEESSTGTAGQLPAGTSRPLYLDEPQRTVV
jgi:gas vesicle protein